MKRRTVLSGQPKCGRCLAKACSCRRLLLCGICRWWPCGGIRQRLTSALRQRAKCPDFFPSGPDVYHKVAHILPGKISTLLVVAEPMLPNDRDSATWAPTRYSTEHTGSERIQDALLFVAKQLLPNARETVPHVVPDVATRPLDAL